MTNPEERGRWRRIDRLVKLVPSLAKRLGCRRKDHETRERVDNVPEGTSMSVVRRRRFIARGTHREQA